jgi:hypothetical protein
VTLVDRQVGLVQQILCDKYHAAHLSACHLLEETLCHLINHCGDDYDRFVQCSSTFDLKAIVPHLVSYLYSHTWILVPFVFMFIMMLALAIIPEFI